MISFERLLDSESYLTLVKNAQIARKQEALVDDARVKECYALAHALYTGAHYREAIHYFRILTLIRPAEAKYWKGFGSTLQMLKMYEEALNCYSAAQILSPQELDPLTYIYAADCFFALNRVEAGLKALHIAEIEAQKKHDKSILKHVAFMQEAWSTAKERV